MMIDAIHIYELAFFGVFLVMLWFVFIPPIKNMLNSYKKSRDHVHDEMLKQQHELSREYAAQKKIESDNDTENHKFIFEINAVREVIQSEESKKNIEKIKIIKENEAKSLEEDLQSAKHIAIKSFLDEIKKNIPASKDNLANLELQMSAMQEYFSLK